MGWTKTTPFGDYSKEKKVSRNVHIIREARTLRVVGKHAGSKPIETLLKSISRAHYAINQAKVS